ncbi:hypothetical protein GY45DRAFT_1332629 [Cubamyces sp. BRFM 1775]|nr:hypothetical protein GY45DRAFT_1332629 [Cubamyces sp. BRFM 1775]
MQCTSCVSLIGPRLPEQHDPECGPVSAGRFLADGAHVYLCRKNHRSRNMHKLSGVTRIVIVSIQPHGHPSVIISKRPHASNQFGTIDSAPPLETITACTRGSPTIVWIVSPGIFFPEAPTPGRANDSQRSLHAQGKTVLREVTQQSHHVCRISQ